MYVHIHTCASTADVLVREGEPHLDGCFNTDVGGDDVLVWCLTDGLRLVSISIPMATIMVVVEEEEEEEEDEWVVSRSPLLKLPLVLLAEQTPLDSIDSALSLVFSSSTQREGEGMREREGEGREEGRE